MESNIGGIPLNTKLEQDRLALARLAETYWAESIIPIQGRIAELTVLIKTEASREERFRLKARRTALRRMRLMTYPALTFEGSCPSAIEKLMALIWSAMTLMATSVFSDS